MRWRRPSPRQRCGRTRSGGSLMVAGGAVTTRSPTTSGSSCRRCATSSSKFWCAAGRRPPCGAAGSLHAPPPLTRQQSASLTCYAEPAANLSECRTPGSDLSALQVWAAACSATAAAHHGHSTLHWRGQAPCRRVGARSSRRCCVGRAQAQKKATREELDHATKARDALRTQVPRPPCRPPPGRPSKLEASAFEKRESSVTVLRCSLCRPGVALAARWPRHVARRGVAGGHMDASPRNRRVHLLSEEL